MKSITLGIIANIAKSDVKQVLPDFFKWLHNEGILFIVASDLSSIIQLDEWNTVPPNEVAANCDFILSFGGDGTFLQTARLIVPRQTPIIGINLGDFGYLAEVNVEEMRKRVKELVNSKYSIQDRMMLEVTAPDTDSDVKYYCLNDVVVDRGRFTRIIRLETDIDGEYLNSFNADGLIVSTPTGSTGYSLSTGGPILEPCVKGIIINPISPHMLANRPLVISDERMIEITTFSPAGAYQLSIDGQKVLEPKSGDKIIIKRSPFLTRLVVFEDYSFNALLRNKLHWRHQLNVDRR